jgi:hypothetical protein
MHHLRLVAILACVVLAPGCYWDAGGAGDAGSAGGDACTRTCGNGLGVLVTNLDLTNHTYALTVLSGGSVLGTCRNVPPATSIRCGGSGGVNVAGSLGDTEMSIAIWPPAPLPTAIDVMVTRDGVTIVNQSETPTYQSVTVCASSCQWAGITLAAP